MGQAGPFKPIALVVEDDMFQREEVAAAGATLAGENKRPGAAIP